MNNIEQSTHNVTTKSSENELIFATSVVPTKVSVTNALLLIESIRAFGGSLSQSEIWCYVPNQSLDLFTDIKYRMTELNVDLIPFEFTEQFPFAFQMRAAAEAEIKGSGKTKFLAWLAANSVILQEPTHFRLPKEKKLAYRPVHHTLIGSRFDEELDPFWIQIYNTCNVPPERVFSMMTHVDSTLIRPYFNAGVLIIRPEDGTLQKAANIFNESYKKPQYQEFYEQDEIYAIFIHQAILSGVILESYPTEDIVELSPTYNYPVHLYNEDTTQNRPSALEDLVTFRHEGFHSEPNWREIIPTEESLKKWIAQHLE